jgi:large conductance mechanosensitive channel
MIAEFREFMSRGNFIDLAVGFVMGVAVSGVVTSLVERVVMPLIGLIFGEPNFDQILTFGGEVDGEPIGSVGAVLTALVNLLFVGLALFFVVKGYNQMQRRLRAGAEESEDEAPADPEDIALLREIRDALKAQRSP